MSLNLIELLESRRLLTSYYLSPAGSDLNPSNDPAHPWQTIAKMDTTSFHAGDSILFQAGQSFGGNLQFGADDSGTTLAGSVGFNGFTRLTQHWNQTAGASWDTGDFNYDGSVNSVDFTLLTRTYNTSLGSQAAPAAVAAIITHSHSRRGHAP